MGTVVNAQCLPGVAATLIHVVVTTPSAVLRTTLYYVIRSY